MAKIVYVERKIAPIRISINSQTLRRNARTGDDAPPIRVQRGADVFYGHEVRCHGYAAVVYPDPERLSCGARVWVETNGMVELIDRREGVE